MMMHGCGHSAMWIITPTLAACEAQKPDEACPGGLVHSTWQHVVLRQRNTQCNGARTHNFVTSLFHMLCHALAAGLHDTIHT